MQLPQVNKADLIAIRSGIQDDKNFIYASWLRGLYYGDSWFSEVPKNVFMEQYHKVIDYILNNPATIVRVACLKEDPTVILGYAILKTDGGVHWVFCKKSWRNIGIAKDLLGSNTKYATHLTKIGLNVAKNKGIIFNPFNV